MENEMKSKPFKLVLLYAELGKYFYDNWYNLTVLGENPDDVKLSELLIKIKEFENDR